MNSINPIRFAAVTVQENSIKSVYQEAGEAAKGEQMVAALKQQVEAHIPMFDVLEQYNVDVDIAGFGNADKDSEGFFLPPNEGYLFGVNPPAIQIALKRDGQNLEDPTLYKDSSPKTMLRWTFENALNIIPQAFEELRQLAAQIK